MKSQTMIRNFELKITFNYFFNITEQILFNLFNRTTVDAYEMMVKMFCPLFTEVISWNTISKINLIQDFQFIKQFQCTIYSSKPDFRIFIFNFHENIFRA